MNLRHLLFTACGLALLAAVTINAEDAKKSKVSKVNCPVAGKEIKIADAKAAEYKGGKVYVCCNNCKAKLEKDATKFAEKANHQLFLTGQAKQTKCPMTGRPVNAKMTVSIGGTDVGLCCGGCKGKASKASDAEKLTLLFSDKAFDKGFEVPKKKS